MARPLGSSWRPQLKTIRWTIEKEQGGGRSQPMEQSTESALVVVVPEVESLVGRYRVLYDPAALEGVPAHVTVLYPFLPPARITAQTETALTELFGATAAFDATFKEVRQFPGVLYLAPTDSTPFRRLTEAVFARFPEAPPYGGKFPEIIPHITVAYASDPSLLAEIRTQFEFAAQAALPIASKVQHVALLEKRGGRWTERRQFSLDVGGT